ncbi:MAG: divalent metal cation transporter [Candidatus Roizmanbacteria bacterium]|nr:divalent metal cation transporter [Candidatus Roizmanbacteria bacterium]
MKWLGTLKPRLLIFLMVLGPGIITSFADNDAGGVATYSVAASQFGYGMLTTLIPITIVLLITQEIGARIAVVTGKGLGDLIREHYGIRISLLIFGLLFFVNFGVILQNLGGLKEALQSFNFSVGTFLPLIIIFLFVFITRASYAKVEKFFLFLILFYVAYLFSAILAKPDWGLVLKSLFVPARTVTFDYVYTSIAVLGTTVTAWGQFFINSYVKDKKLTIDRLHYNQAEIYIGSLLTNVFSLFMMVAVTATLFNNGITITGAADAALAIKPFAGELASLLFGTGLLVAGFIGLAIVPLATAYAFSEFFGVSGSLNETFGKSRTFYVLFIMQILLGLVFILSPNITLFNITLYADYLNGIFLPIILFFLYRFANNKELMGEHVNNQLQNALLIGAGVIITGAALIGALGNIL